MSYSALSLIMLLAQFSPGPDMLLLLRNSLRHPARAGLWTVAGIACGLSVHLIIVLVGLGAVIQSHPVIYPLLLVMGGLWLTRLAVSLLKSLSFMADGTAGEATVAPLPDRQAFLQGLLTNLSNVKAMIFLGGVVLQWLGPEAGTDRKLALFGIVIGQALFFWSLFVLALQHRRVRRLWNRSQRVLTGLFGAGLLLLSLHAVWQGTARLLHRP
ncbi:MAG: hypothetical protein EOP86_00235 [Verrucomicrobiaceae bacterium]|nr:MAG: hypothetical protein EOP86_00235 [Verrucomicrobiaceae bacterium]